MRVSVNGEPADVGDGATVADVVAVRASGARRAAVALNGEVVPRSAWSDTVLTEDDAVEVLTAAAGG